MPVARDRLRASLTATIGDAGLLALRIGADTSGPPLDRPGLAVEECSCREALPVIEEMPGAFVVVQSWYRPANDPSLQRRVVLAGCGMVLGERRAAGAAVLRGGSAVFPGSHARSHYRRDARRPLLARLAHHADFTLGMNSRFLSVRTPTGTRRSDLKGPTRTLATPHCLSRRLCLNSASACARLRPLAGGEARPGRA
jgi:hypothetical protein